MKQLFLTSEINLVAEDISTKVQTVSGKLRTAFITTPLEKGHEQDDLAWSKQNEASMKKAGFDIFMYTITGKTADDLKRDLAGVDVIYVEGGSLVHMMNQVRLSGFDIFLREFVSSGGVYLGTSTGSFIAAENTAPGLSLEFYLEDGFNPEGIGLVNFLVMPHWGESVFKKYYEKMPQHAYSMKVPMVILTDTQYVWVRGDSLQIIDIKK